MADEIVRLHNGVLDVDSIFGEGTTVRITLPIEPVEYETADTEGENITNEQKEE